MESTEIVQAIVASSPVVAAARADLDEAIEAERAAETAVLDGAIEAARAALRAISTRIVRESYETGGRNGCNPVSRTTYHDARGLVLVDLYDKRKDSTGNRGDLTGERLYLLSDGRLAVVTRTGSFSHWQGEADEWESTLAYVTTREAMDEYELDECLVSIRDALQKQLDGKGADRAKAARERAARLSALVTLSK